MSTPTPMSWFHSARPSRFSCLLTRRIKLEMQSTPNSSELSSIFQDKALSKDLGQCWNSFDICFKSSGDGPYSLRPTVLFIDDFEILEVQETGNVLQLTSFLYKHRLDSDNIKYNTHAISSIARFPINSALLPQSSRGPAGILVCFASCLHFNLPTC